MWIQIPGCDFIVLILKCCNNLTKLKMKLKMLKWKYTIYEKLSYGQSFNIM